MKKKKKEKDLNKNHPQFCLYCGDQLTKDRVKKEMKICPQCEE